MGGGDWALHEDAERGRCECQECGVESQCGRVSAGRRSVSDAKSLLLIIKGCHGWLLRQTL